MPQTPALYFVSALRDIWEFALYCSTPRGVELRGRVIRVAKSELIGGVSGPISFRIGLKGFDR
jgi:hypothetical protein